jgi:peptidoglycan/LPS O-acetylase OafA/YrhL
MQTLRPTAQSESPSKLECLEALRGMAAVMVLLNHLMLAFWPELAFHHGDRWNQAPTALQTLASFPGPYLWDSELAVTVFFVLSGFVLSLSFFRNPALALLESAAVRRYPRLLLPVGASVLCAYVLMQAGAMRNREAAVFINSARDSTVLSELGREWQWLHDHYAFPPALSTALRDAVWGAFGTQFRYNLVLWTMPIELFGSFLVFGILGVAGRLRNRWLVYLLAAAWLVQGKQLFFLDFLLGIALCDLWTQNERHWKLELPAAPAVLVISVAIFLVSFKPLAAVLLIAATTFAPRLRQFLAAPVFAFLGRVSFALYLLHTMILCSLGSFLYLALARGWTWPHHAAAAAASATTIAASFLAAWAFAHAIDRRAIVMGRRIDEWLFRPEPRNDNAASAKRAA